LRAIFDNDEETLFPNQFVNVKLLVDTLHNASIVPVSSVQRGAPGTFVYVTKPDQTVAVRNVKLGPGDGQRVAVLSGLEPGEQVVSDGADRLRDGAKITVAPAGRSNAAAEPPAPQRAGQAPGSTGEPPAPQRAGQAPGSAGEHPAGSPEQQGRGHRRTTP
jgi:multidrug efflux system membrane fusion protein